MNSNATYASTGLFDRLRRFKARSPLLSGLVLWVRYMIAWAWVFWGGLVHWLRGETPKKSHLALVTLFAMSGGRDNDRLARAVEIMQPPYRLSSASGVLGNLSQRDLATIQAKLASDGYYVFENTLTEQFCENILRRTLEVDCWVIGDEVTGKGRTEFRRFNRAKPDATAFVVQRDDTTDIPEIQQLLCDDSLIAVAQNYLRAKPIFSAVVLSWSAAIKDRPDNDAAQEFHWDMERIRWLRYFIYLTDVTADAGPHCFISGTHKTGAIPKELYRQGYVRHTDDEIIAHYGKDRYREFTGKRGTIIAEDSRGFHKGAVLRKGDRLLLAFEMSTTTFGANKRHLIRNIHVPQFAELAKKYPRLYSNFDFSPGL
jgi:ectoine hydroxylase-related dioxygenase (phytanoyl-CoA dioxygenase family)